MEKDNQFGTGDGFVTFRPTNYSVKENQIANAKYRIHHMPEEYQDFIGFWKEKLEKLEAMDEPEKVSLTVMQAAPV